MDEQGKDIARRAAGRLEADFGPALPALVERELQHPDAGRAALYRRRDGDRGGGLAGQHCPVRLADVPRPAQGPAAVSPEGLARQLRLSVEVPPQVTPANRDRLIAVVVEEVMAAAPDV